MPLVNTKAMLKKAAKGGYAVGHFNTNNIEISQAIREAAEEMNAPVIIGVSHGAIDYAGLKVLVETIKNCMDRKGLTSKIPYAIHLDHGDSVQLAKKCIRGQIR